MMQVSDISGTAKTSRYGITGGGKRSLQSKLNSVFGKDKVRYISYPPYDVFEERGRRLEVMVADTVPDSKLAEIRAADCKADVVKAEELHNGFGVKDTATKLLITLGYSWFGRFKSEIEYEIRNVDRLLYEEQRKGSASVDFYTNLKARLIKVYEEVGGTWTEEDRICKACGTDGLVNPDTHRCDPCQSNYYAIYKTNRELSSMLQSLKDVSANMDVQKLIGLLKDAKAEAEAKEAVA